MVIGKKADDMRWHQKVDIDHWVTSVDRNEQTSCSTREMGHTTTQRNVYDLMMTEDRDWWMKQIKRCWTSTSGEAGLHRIQSSSDPCVDSRYWNEDLIGQTMIKALPNLHAREWSEDSFNGTDSCEGISTFCGIFQLREKRCSNPYTVERNSQVQFCAFDHVNR